MGEKVSWISSLLNSLCSSLCLQGRADVLLSRRGRSWHSALEDIYLETLIIRILFISNNFLLILQFPQATSPEMSFLWISYNPIFLVYDIWCVPIFQCYNVRRKKRFPAFLRKLPVVIAAICVDMWKVNPVLSQCFIIKYN